MCAGQVAGHMACDQFRLLFFCHPALFYSSRISFSLPISISISSMLRSNC